MTKLTSMHVVPSAESLPGVELSSVLLVPGLVPSGLIIGLLGLLPIGSTGCGDQTS